jgi:hypothetical protein
MRRRSAVAVSLIIAACGAGGEGSSVRQLPSDPVDNLLVISRDGDLTHFAGTSATFQVRGRCIVAMTEQGERTPVFMVDVGLRVTDAAVLHGDEVVVRMGEPTGIGGHHFWELGSRPELDLGGCPRQVVSFTSITPATPARPVVERPPS